MTFTDALFVALIALSAACGAAFAQDHPVYPETLDAGAVASARSRVAQCMALSEAEVRQMLTGKAGFYEIGCPNCTGGEGGRQLGWDPSHPDRLKCVYCGHEYPSEKYPMDKVYEHVAPTGETQQYPYWEGPDGYHHYFDAKIEFQRRGWLVSCMTDCARIYHATGEGPYARRAAVILQRLAETYASIPIHGLDGYTYRRPVFADNEPPHPYLSGKFTSTWFYGEISAGAVSAYDLIHTSPELDNLGRELGVDVRAQIEKDLLRAMADFTLTFDRWITNMTPSWARGLIRVGRVVGEPVYVHEGIGLLDRTLNEQFFADGAWSEGAVSYHLQTVGGLRSAYSSALGYSDPDGYVFPATAKRFDDLDPIAENPFLARCLAGMEPLAYPDGVYACVHDTWPNTKTDPAAEAMSVLKWSMGHACLESKSGPLAAELQLHFSGSHGHAHRDPLNITYWAYGHELVSDLGYTHTIYRNPSQCTAFHNTVVVDERPASAGGRAIPWPGELRLWLPDGHTCKAASVSYPTAYGVTDLYQRAVALIDRPDAPAYAVDFFDVRGGTQHDWFLRGSADDDQTAATALDAEGLDYSLLGPGRALVPYINEGGYPLVSPDAVDANQQPPEGAEVQYNPYGLIRDLKRTRTDGDFAAAFGYLEEGKPKMELRVLGAPGSEYFLGTSPSIKRARNDSSKVDDIRQPVLVARRSAEADLQSRFCAVLWPYTTDSDLQAFTPLAVDGQTVGVAIEFGPYVDVVLSPIDKPAEPLHIQEYDITTDAAFTMVRLRNGVTVAVEACDGTSVEAPGVHLSLPGVMSGRITSAVGGLSTGRTTITVDGIENAFEPPDGSDVFVTHADGAFSLLRVEAIKISGDAAEITLSEPPDFTVEGASTQFKYYPIRTIEGQPTFRIVPNISWSEAP